MTNGLVAHMVKKNQCHGLNECKMPTSSTLEHLVPRWWALRGNETFGAQVGHYGVSTVDKSGPLFAAQAFWSMPCEKQPPQASLPWTRASSTTRLSLT